MTARKDNNLLLIEDHADISEMLTSYFAGRGFSVDYAADGLTGLHLAVTNRYDAIILDLMLPGMDGVSICEKLRRDARDSTPIIMLTARGEENDKVRGLDSGADDFITKPFSTRELLARVRAVLRRTEGGTKRLSHYSFSDLELNFESYAATKGGEALELSPREFELLRYLIERKGETVTRDKLLEDVWGYDSYPSTRTVDTHIAKLRAKIGDSGSEPRWILTIHGMGYKFIDPS